MLLPVHGRFLIWDGHDFYSHHRRFDFVSPTARQLGFRSNVLRYAYDFFMLNEANESERGDPAKNESWFAFGQPVYAAEAGVVVKSVDTQPDKRRMDISRLKTDRMEMFGNYIIIRHTDGAFALYGHIRQGSAKCKAGDHIEAGQVIASIGAAGAASVPHLHFEIQTTADADGEGLPSSFKNFHKIMGGKRTIVAQGYINTGDIVQSDEGK